MTDQTMAAATMPAATAADAIGAVRVGIYASALRCILTYLVMPTLGAVGVVLGPVGFVLQVLGAVTSLAGARRLWELGHPARFAYAVVAATIAVMTVSTLLAGVLR